MLVMHCVTYNIFGKGKLYVGQGEKCSGPGKPLYTQDSVIHVTANLRSRHKPMLSYAARPAWLSGCAVVMGTSQAWTILQTEQSTGWSTLTANTFSL